MEHQPYQADAGLRRQQQDNTLGGDVEQSDQPFLPAAVSRLLSQL